MKKIIIAAMLLLVCNIVTLTLWGKSLKEVNAYHQYYEATENLLDELDQHYDWVDAFDPYDYYDAVERLNN